MSITAVILAAGKSSRMHAQQKKIFLELQKKPIVRHVMDAVHSVAEVDAVALVHSPEDKKILDECLQGCALPLHYCEQAEARGTADAVHCALDVIETAYCLIVLGDVPCISAAVLSEFCKEVAAQKTLGVLTMQIDNPTGYGRIVRLEEEGGLHIVEEVELSDSQRDIKEVNTGIFCAPTSFLSRAIPCIAESANKKEFYLTELPKLWAQQKGTAAQSSVLAYKVPKAENYRFWGVNTLSDYQRLKKRMNVEKAESLLRQGVWVEDTQRFECDGELICAPGCRIASGVRFEGRVALEEGASVGQGCIIKNSQLGRNTQVHPYSVLDGAVLEHSVKVGPFAYVRGQTHLEEGAEIGCFVEAKNTHLGRLSKAKHLSYLGDLRVEDSVNIGAGVIHCNYDGKQKHTSVIESHCFIGADTQLIGPLRIGKGAKVAAGTTVVKNVSEKARVRSRVPQVEKV